MNEKKNHIIKSCSILVKLTQGENLCCKLFIPKIAAIAYKVINYASQRRQRAWLSVNCHYGCWCLFRYWFSYVWLWKMKNRCPTVQIVYHAYVLQEWIAKMFFCFGSKSSRCLNIASYLYSLFQLFMKMEYVVPKRCMNEVL